MFQQRKTGNAKIGVFVGERGKWSFFTPIFQDLGKHWPLEVFTPPVYHPAIPGRVVNWDYARRMRSVLARNQVCFFEWASELLVPASQMTKQCTIVTRLHSYELFVWAPRVNWNNVDRVVLVSDAMKRKFCDLYPDHAHKASVVHNGVDLGAFNPPDSRCFEFRIGMLANLHPVKRIYEAILTIAALRDRGLRPHLHIAGGRWEGGHFDSYAWASRSLVRKLRLEDNVTWHDHVKAPQEWLRRIDIFLSNSYWEGQQTALLEAMATGCFCLSHSWDGAEEILPPHNLYLTEGELVERLVWYAALDETERSAQQQLMRAIACEKFDLENTRAGIRGLLEEFLPGPVRATRVQCPEACS